MFTVTFEILLLCDIRDSQFRRVAFQWVIVNAAIASFITDFVSVVGALGVQAQVFCMCACLMYSSKGQCCMGTCMMYWYRA